MEGHSWHPEHWRKQDTVPTGGSASNFVLSNKLQSLLLIPTLAVSGQSVGTLHSAVTGPSEDYYESNPFSRTAKDDSVLSPWRKLKNITQADAGEINLEISLPQRHTDHQ